MSDKRFDVRRLTLAAEAEDDVRYDFQPDQIAVVSETVINDVIDILVEGAQGGTPLPLYAQGPLVFPGVTPNQGLHFTNPDLTAHVLRLVAQKGYLPTAIVVPTSLAIPSTIVPTAINTLQDTTDKATPAVYTFNIDHPGGPLLILAGSRSSLAANWASCTVAGWSMTRIASQGNAAANDPFGALFYRATDLPAGNLALVLTSGGAGTVRGAQVYCVALNPNVVVGNVTATTSATLSVIVQAASAWAVYAIACHRSTADITEGSSAVQLFDLADDDGKYEGFRKQGVGAGTQVFTFASGAGAWANLGVELFLP